MQSKLFFFDFDDTLYSHRIKSVPKSTREAIGRLQSLGHRVVIATGRGPESIAFIQEQLALPCETITFLNGQLVFHQGRKVFERFIQLPSVGSMMEKARTHGFAYGGHCEHGEIVDHVNERVQAVWSDFSSPLPKEMARFEASYPLYQAHLYITKEEARYMEEYLDDYLTNWSHEYLVNLISKQAGKSQAIRWLMAEAGIPQEHSFAFGDGFNDVDMLLAVGHGIAMGNATDELKSVAELVTGSADEDGIWEALHDYKII
ncbi:HAD family hydrolase [Paenibacillus physcomitrellae]|uniref:Phosphatase n=1 Tax=Paenibacillus physcomitrellae TaxID=1619311 RepID=A0ABQ1FL94_9BACL|nr:Cof-type HAD-IIB family hydrolase [Paenibacillus physcomitrellae]GGA19920.1 phosphatase [Paenibacillus physcomitrellae]